jgi:hypothetical protein
MNTVSIIPQLILNVLQNMNTKRDTLEKRAFIKNRFQETTLMNNTAVSDDAVELEQIVEKQPEYTPSLEEQYLPKTLRGANSNPYSIMNAVSQHVANPPDANNVVPATTSAAALEVSMIPADLKNDNVESLTPSGSEVIIS